MNRFFLKRFLYLLIGVFFNRVNCTICNWSGFKFYKSYCPLCFSQRRHRLLGYILDKINLEEYKKILFIGPGPTEILISKLKFKNNNIKYLNNFNRSYINVVFDITDDNIHSTNYDVIIMWHVLEHIENDIKSVNNIKKMLKPNGIFLFSVPIYPPENKNTYIPTFKSLEEKIKLTGHHDHFICPGYDYPERFSKIKFSNLIEYNVKDFSLSIINRYDLSRNHAAWHYVK